MRNRIVWASAMETDRQTHNTAYEVQITKLLYCKPKRNLLDPFTAIAWVQRAEHPTDGLCYVLLVEVLLHATASLVFVFPLSNYLACCLQFIEGFDLFYEHFHVLLTAATVCLQDQPETYRHRWHLHLRPATDKCEWQLTHCGPVFFSSILITNH
jgi:hypothetical protein